MAYRAVGVGTSVTIPNPAAAAVQTDYFDVQTETIRLVARGADCHVTVGSTPSATTQNLYIPSGGSMSLGMTKASQRVVGITTGTTETILSFPEGQQCPFGVGNYISVETSDGYAGITSYLQHVRVISVDTTGGAGANQGYWMTRCTIAADTRKCYAAGADWSDATAIASNKVSIIGGNTGGGALYVQQVQITGDA